MNDFTFTDKGFSDYVYWQSQDRKTAKRINSLLVDIKRNGAMQGIGKPEPLKYRPGYSRRIDEKNRLVYDIDELQNIKIISLPADASLGIDASMVRLFPNAWNKALLPGGEVHQHQR